MAIVGYARVSTRGQSLDAQIKALKEYGVEDGHLFMEKESGAKRDRPELEAVIRFVRKGDSLVVTKLDRIARSTKHLLDIATEFQQDDKRTKELGLTEDELAFYDLLAANEKLLNEAGPIQD